LPAMIARLLVTTADLPGSDRRPAGTDRHPGRR